MKNGAAYQRSGLPQPPYHGAAYYPELWPEENIDRDIKQMHEAGINVVRIGEFAWANMETVEGKFSFDFFIRVMDKMHAASIATVMCTPTATPPIWVIDGHPNRCVKTAEGVILSHGSRQHASYCHPDVRKYCFRIVDELAKAVGKHPGLLAWQIDNELKCHVDLDFSEYSVKMWHNWLENRYKTIDALNKAWGTEIWSETYARFDQIPPAGPTPFIHNTSLQTAWYEFGCDNICDFAHIQADLIRKHSVAPISHNSFSKFPITFEKLFSRLDFAAFDDYATTKQYSRIVMECDMFRAVKQGKPFWLMETSCAHNGWLTFHETVHPDGYLTAELLAAHGLGAEATLYWLWKQQRTGCELPHSAVISSWGKPSIGHANVLKTTEKLREYASFFNDTAPTIPEVALIWSDRGRMMLRTEPLGKNDDYKYNFNLAMEWWHQILLFNGYHRDVRFEGASLDGLKLLLTPNMPHVTNEFIEKATKFMQAGGVWIVGPLTGHRTAEHTVNTDACLGKLEALAGVEVVYHFPVTGSGSIGKAFDQQAPLVGWTAAMRPTDAHTRVIGTMHGKNADGYAFITERHIGKGMMVMLGSLPDGEDGNIFAKTLIQHYANRAGVQPFNVTKGLLVVPRLDDHEKTHLFVVNMEDQPGTLTLPTGVTHTLNAYESKIIDPSKA